MAASFPENPPNWDSWNEFCEWFWKNNFGNEIIDRLNESAARTTDYLRRERDGSRPMIYAIILNNSGLDLKDWKFCFVSLTQMSTIEGTGNIMESVKSVIETEHHNGKASVLFVIPVNAVDTSPFPETESRTRAHFGLQVDKDLAKELKLPFPTDWVLTTQAFIDKVKAETKAKNASTKLFKNTKFVFTKCPALPEWLEVDESTKTVCLKQGTEVPKPKVVAAKKMNKTKTTTKQDRLSTINP